MAASPIKSKILCLCTTLVLLVAIGTTVARFAKQTKASEMQTMADEVNDARDNSSNLLMDGDGNKTESPTVRGRKNPFSEKRGNLKNRNGLGMIFLNIQDGFETESDNDPSSELVR